MVNTSVKIDIFESILNRMNDELISRINMLGTSRGRSANSDDMQLKELTGIFKLLQGVEEMIKRIQEHRDRQRSTAIDALEFRRKLEEQIAILVNKESERSLS